MKATSPRRYVALFFLTVIAICVAVGLLNAWVDPYGNLGLNRAGVFMGAEREYKPVQLRRYPHDAIILGNSMVGAANPDHIQSPLHFYNASLAGVTAPELRYFVERHVHQEKLVVVALDFNMFRLNPSMNFKQPLPDSFTDNVLKRIFNLETVEHSINTLKRSARGDTPGYRPNGASWNEIVKRVELDRQTEGIHYGSVPEEARRYFSRYVYDPRCMEEMKKMKAILDKRGISLAVYINPRHQEISTILRESPAYPTYLEWIRQLREVFPGVVDLSGPEFASPENYYRFDPGHTTPEASARVINTVLLKK